MDSWRTVGGSTNRQRQKNSICVRHDVPHASDLNIFQHAISFTHAMWDHWMPTGHHL
jgi:hypothetical protein